MSLTTIPAQAKSVLATEFAKGKSTQQMFSAVRATGHNISYQQVVNYRTHYESQFDSSFASIFQS